MVCSVCDIPVNYVEYGEGKPVLFIHGSHVDHRVMVDSFEPIFNEIQGYRRIYLDLPGTGKTPSAGWIKSSDNTLEVVMEFINTVIGEEGFLLAGQSYGGYISLGLIHKIGDRVDGMLLLCPQLDPQEDENLPARQIIYKSKQMGSININSNANEYYMDMAVIVTPQTFSKWQSTITPALEAADMEFLSARDEWYDDDLHNAVSQVVFDKPSCILTGRQDNITGYKIAYKLVERFTRATFAVADCAGHMMQAEREPLFKMLVKDWFERVERYS